MNYKRIRITLHKLKKRIANLLLQRESIQFIRCTSYEEALAKSKNTGGYAATDILQKCKESMLLVKNGQAVYERDSVIFDEIHYNFPLAATLLKIAIEKKNTLNILDFGGSLGSTYYQCKSFFKDLEMVRWNVVEQKQFVDCGREFFQDKELIFHDSIKDCIAFSNVKPNTILLSGVLPYLDIPYHYLKEIVSHKFKYIIIDRTFFLGRNRDAITIQKTPETICQAIYPAWFLSEKKLKSFLNKNGYYVAYEWGSFVQMDTKDVPFNEPCSDKGILFKRK